MLSCLPTTFNCSILPDGKRHGLRAAVGAAGRSRAASFAQLVVLPAPCRPAIITMVGGFGDMVKRVVWPPKSETSSSFTILMTCWVGDRLSRISASVAFSVTVLMRSCDLEVDVRLEQCHADFLHCVLDIGLGQPSLLRRCLKADEIFR